LFALACYNDPHDRGKIRSEGHMNEYVGQQLGNYRLLRLIGQGGFADVYLGEHIHLRTQAAIKILQMRLAEEHAQAFINEARTIAHLVHPNIVRVLDFGVQNSVPFLVMDYAPGGTLRQRMPPGKPLSVDGIFPFLTQVASALQYAHNRKLIHRDIKPENILVGVHGEVLLSDFGLALVTQSTSSRSIAAGSDMAGTATYMAPEQVQGSPRSASDQYALAVVVYEWLTGSRPFQGSFLEVATQQVLAPTPSLRAKVPTISPAIDEVVMRALAKEPQQRYPSVVEFAAALGQVCLQEGIISEQAALAGQTIMSMMASAGHSPLGNISQLTYLPSTTNQDAQSAYSTSPAISSSPAPTPPAPQLSFMKSPASQGVQKQAAGTGMDLQESQLTFVKTPSTSPTTNAPTTDQSLQWPTRSDPALAQTGWPSPHAELTEVAPLPSGQPGMKPQILNNTQVTPQQFPYQAAPSPYTQQQHYPTSSGPGMFGSQPFVTPAPVDNNSADVVRALRQATHTNRLLLVISLLLICMLVIGGGTGIWYFTHLRQPSKQPPVVTDRGHKTAVPSAPATAAATGTAGATVATPVPGNGAATPPAVSTPTAAATTTPVAGQQPNPYAPSMGTLVFNDPMSSNQQNWDQTGGCAFAGGAYHVVQPVGQAVVCYAKSTNYTNFTYEVQMTFGKATPSDAGGIEFRGNPATGASYRIEVFADGRYSILVCSTSTVCSPVAGSPPQPQPAASFHAGANTLAIVANSTTITFFMNGQPVGAPVQDATSAQGMIGVYGVAGATGAGIDVAYNNARVWQ
jgi:serine/threonine protein kinase